MKHLISVAVALLDDRGVIKHTETGFVQLRENLKKRLFGTNQGKPGKLREFSDHFYYLRENSGNFILPNIYDQIGCALRINE